MKADVVPYLHIIRLLYTVYWGCALLGYRLRGLLSPALPVRGTGGTALLIRQPQSPEIVGGPPVTSSPCPRDGRDSPPDPTASIP